MEMHRGKGVVAFAWSIRLLTLILCLSLNPTEYLRCLLVGLFSPMYSVWRNLKPGSQPAEQGKQSEKLRFHAC